MIGKIWSLHACTNISYTKPKHAGMINVWGYSEILPKIFFLNKATKVSKQLLPVYIVIAKSSSNVVVRSYTAKNVVNIPATYAGE